MISLLDFCLVAHGLATITKRSTLEYGKQLRVKGNPFCEGDKLSRPVVEKVSRFQFNIGTDIQSRENRLAKSEGREPKQFGPLPWGQWLNEESAIIEHKGNHYLRGTYLKSLETAYYVNGNAATDDEIAIIRQFRMGDDKELDIMNVKLSHIERIVCNKQTWEK